MESDFSEDPIITLCVEVKPYQLQYIIWRENLESETTPLQLPGLGIVTHVLYCLLCDESAYSIDYGRATQRKARLFYQIRQRSQSRRLFVNSTGTYHFSRFLDQLIIDDISKSVFDSKMEKGDQKDTIDFCLQRAGLDRFDIDADNIKKSLWRLRTHRNQPTIRGKTPRIKAKAAIKKRRNKVYW